MEKLAFYIADFSPVSLFKKLVETENEMSVWRVCERRPKDASQDSLLLLSSHL